MLIINGKKCDYLIKMRPKLGNYRDITIPDGPLI